MHCDGGRGPDETDWLSLIENWVEKGIAPERVIMSKKENDKVVMTRPVFPFPKVAVYTGKGDANEQQNFIEK